MALTDYMRLKCRNRASSYVHGLSVIQSQTKRPVQFEASEGSRESIWNWLCSPEMLGCAFLFPSRFYDRPHVSTRQHAWLVRDWVSAIDLDPRGQGTHALRRTLRAVQLLLAHTNVDSTVRHLGVELEDALSVAEKIDI